MPPPAVRSEQEDRQKGGDRLRRGALAAASQIVPKRNPGGAVYGLIAVGALLAAESKLPETYPETVGSIAIAVVVYWLAHGYSHVLGARLERGRRLSRRHAFQIVAEDWTIATGALLPLLAVVLAWLAGGSKHSGVQAGLFTAIASIVAFELTADLRTRAGIAALVLDAAVGIVIGLGILALTVVVH